MKLSVFFVLMMFCLTIASPVFANGPMDPAPQPNTTTSQTNPHRQKWVNHRIHVLEKRQEHYENEKTRAGLMLVPFGTQMGDPIEYAKFKAWEAQNKPQRHKEKVETLMLKRENGTITPAENAALNKWIRQHTKHK